MDALQKLTCHVDGEKKGILIVRGPTTIECRSGPAQVAWFPCDVGDDAIDLAKLLPNRWIQLGASLYLASPTDPR